MTPGKTIKAVGIGVAVAGLAMAVLTYVFMQPDSRSDSELSVATTNANAQGAPIAPGKDSSEALSLNLSDSQLTAVKVEPIEEREFPVEKEAVGSIDFNEDMEVQVFTPYQGRIIALFAQVGDDVKKGQTLFTIDSPDLLQAEIHFDRCGGSIGDDHAQSRSP